MNFKQTAVKIGLAGALAVTGLGVGAVSDVPGMEVNKAEASTAWHGESYYDVSIFTSPANFKIPTIVQRGVAVKAVFTHYDALKNETMGIYRREASGSLTWVRTASRQLVDIQNTYQHTFTVPTNMPAGDYIAIIGGQAGNSYSQMFRVQ